MWDFMLAFPDEKACRDYLFEVRWSKGISCPHCKENKIYTLSDGIRYKCSKCRRQFRVTTGTVFEHRNVPLQKMFLAYFVVISTSKGMSSVKLADWLKVTQTTAWHMLHKIRLSLKSKSEPKQLQGVVEADETYIGQRHKRGSKRGRGGEHKTPVFGIIQRNGRVMTFPVPDTKGKTLKPLIRKHVAEGSRLMTDEYKSYKGLSLEFEHKTVNHGAHEYVNGEAYTNTIENYWQILKSGFRGVYHRPSRKYMKNYCLEFDFRFNMRGMNNNARFYTAISKSSKTIKYKDVIG